MLLQANPGTASWRRLTICLAVMGLLLGVIPLHALHFSVTAHAVVSSGHQSAKRQSFDSDATYCVAPPRIFALEPAPAVAFRAMLVQDVFLPALPQGWYANR